MSSGEPSPPITPSPDGDEIAAAWFTGGALCLFGGLLLAVPAYSILASAWGVASGAIPWPLERGAIRDGVMALVIGFFGLFMLRIGTRTLRRELARRRGA